MARKRKRKKPVYVADFETTVYSGQTDTRVWASAVVKMNTEDVKIFHTIEETLGYLSELEEEIIVYYHNLKFDGSFWLCWFLEHGYENALEGTETRVTWSKTWEMKPKTIKYSVSAQNRWYTLTVCFENGHVCEMRDSLKLLPFSVKKIGKSFGTKHKKLDMEYEGVRYPGCVITDKEKEYIANDVLVVKEALEIMYAEGHKKLTIGACCLAEYKQLISKRLYDASFPSLYDFSLDADKWPDGNAGEWIRRSYKGGWCYLVPEKARKVYSNGITADVNSLYPSVMSGESENLYPVGLPHFWEGNFIPDECFEERKLQADGKNWEGVYWFVRIRTRFYLKPGMLPTIQIKGDWRYPGNEWLKTSDVRNPKTGEYESAVKDRDGNVTEARPELTLTMTDYNLMRKHYELPECEILGGCYFRAESGLFDTYINKYREIKIRSKGAIRTLAKLFLNNLYGKFGSSPDSSFKVARLENGILKYDTVPEAEKTPGYVAVGSAVTSYARNFTITAAQKNYHGGDRGFIYADTDSIHCDLNPEEVKGIRVDPTAFLCWKLEGKWDQSFFTRQKTYMEHVVAVDLQDCDPFWTIKCAGMGQHCKDLFEKAIDPDFRFEDLPESEKEKYPEDERKFLSRKLRITDFIEGLEVPGQLKGRNIPGGVLLIRQNYKMTEK